MKTIIDIYKLNKGYTSLFEKFITVGWYDGPTEAICKVHNTDKWVMCSLVYCNSDNSDQIFNILEIEENWIDKRKNVLEDYDQHNVDNITDLHGQIKNYFKKYTGNLYLFRGYRLDSTEYRLIQIDVRHLVYFGNIEKVYDQTEEEKLKWTGFFDIKRGS